MSSFFGKLRSNAVCARRVILEVVASVRREQQPFCTMLSSLQPIHNADIKRLRLGKCEPGDRTYADQETRSQSPPTDTPRKASPGRWPNTQ